MNREYPWSMHRRRWMFVSSSMALACANSRSDTEHMLWAADSATPMQTPPICVFVKPLQELTFASLADQLAKWPVHGAEVTVRKGGWIEPKDAREQLPRLMDELQRVDRSTVILATDIQSADHPDIKLVLEPASKLGIRHFRLGYVYYDLEQPILPQLDHYAKEFQALAQQCQKLSLQGLYQNHAGAKYVGAPLWICFTSWERSIRIVWGWRSTFAIHLSKPTRLGLRVMHC